MAPSKSTDSTDLGRMDRSGERSQSSGVETDQSISQMSSRASKRRRLSDSSTSSFSSSSNYPEQSNNDLDTGSEADVNVAAPKPLPSLSRIRKKGTLNNKGLTSTSASQNPVSIGEALEIGLQSAESTFSAMGVAPWLVGSLSNMAIRRPTAIQKECIPEILRGKDCIGGSRTGSGKTLAFAVPMLQKWAVDPFGVFGLVLTPTRYAFLSFLYDELLSRRG